MTARVGTTRPVLRNHLARRGTSSLLLVLGTIIVALTSGCTGAVEAPKAPTEPPTDEVPETTDVPEFLVEVGRFDPVNESEETTIDGEVPVYAAKNEVLVHLREGVTERQFESLASHISSLGGTVSGSIPDAYMVQVRVPDGTNEWEIARTLEAMPGVESAGLNLEVRFGPLLELETPENSSAAVATPAAGDVLGNAAVDSFRFHGDWGWWIEATGLDRAWLISTGSTSDEAVIGIVDTGVPAGQQVVAEDRLTRLRAIYRGGGFRNLHERVYLEPVSGDRTYRGTGQGNHGLIVTCFAGGNTESKYGPKRGVAWHNRIMSVDIDLGEDAEDRGRTRRRSYVHQSVEAVIGAINRGADIINLSFNSMGSEHRNWSDHSRSALRLQWKRRMHPAVRHAAKHDVLLINSSGNAAFKNDDTVLNGVWNTHVLTVAAVSKPDQEGLSEEAWYSNFGGAVDIAAPGDNLGCGEYTTGVGIFATGGTSIAAPIVAGTAALMKSVDPSLTAPEIRETILRTARPTVRFSGTGASHPNKVLDACRAVEAVRPGGPLSPVFVDKRRNVLSDLDDVEYRLDVPINAWTLPRAESRQCRGTRLHYVLSGLPEGLSFDPLTRKLTGTPTAPGVYHVAYEVHNGAGLSDVLMFEIAVRGDAQGGRIYWSENGAIRRASIDGSNIETLLSFPPDEAPLDIALDAAEESIYWANTDGIWRATQDGANVTAVVVMYGVRSIVLNADSREVYWAMGDEIYAANLDGSNARRVLVAGFPAVELALDGANGKIYWINSNADVWRADIDGPDRHMVATIDDVVGREYRAGDIALDPGRAQVYWTVFRPDTGSSLLSRSDALNDATETLLGLAVPSAPSARLLLANRSGRMSIALDLRRTQRSAYLASGAGSIDRKYLDADGVEKVIEGASALSAIALEY